MTREELDSLRIGRDVRALVDGWDNPSTGVLGSQARPPDYWSEVVRLVVDPPPNGAQRYAVGMPDLDDERTSVTSHASALRFVLKLEEDIGGRLGLGPERTFAGLIKRLLAGVPAEPERTALLAGWMRTLSGRCQSETNRQELLAAAEYFESGR